MDQPIAFEKLLEFPIFRGLTHETEALQKLATHMRYQVFQSREFIVEEKRPDDRMFFLSSGEVEINKMNAAGQVVVVGRVNARAHPYFGEGALLGKSVRIANVVAHTQSECLVLSAQDFSTYMSEHPMVAASIYRNIAIVLFDRLAKANRDLLIAGLE